nr:unnamed protein product [Callosobruchus chinensis]
MMSNFNKKRPLTQKELKAIAENWNFESDDSEMGYTNDEVSENDEDRDLTEMVSESEDNLEIQSDEDAEEEPEEIQENDILPTAPKFISKSGMEWFSQPFPTTRRLKRNIVKNIRPGITQYSDGDNTFTEIFNLFITTEMKDVICYHTDQEVTKYYDSWNAKNPGKPKKMGTTGERRIRLFLMCSHKSGCTQMQKRINERDVDD